MQSGKSLKAYKILQYMKVMRNKLKRLFVPTHDWWMLMMQLRSEFFIHHQVKALPLFLSAHFKYVGHLNSIE